MLSNVTKKMWWESDDIKQLEQKSIMSLMLKFSWELLFFESGDTEVFKADSCKPFASNKRQIDNHTLMLDIIHSYMSVVCSYHCRGVFKNVFFYTRQPLGWKSRRPQNDVY